MTHLSISTKPLIIGEPVSALLKRQRGCVRIVAWGPINKNGMFNVSLYNQKTDKYFSKSMTRLQLSRASKNDGIELVWVEENGN